MGRDEDILHNVFDRLRGNTATMGRSPNERKVLAVDVVEGAHPPLHSPRTAESVTADSKD